jgi:transposase
MRETISPTISTRWLPREPSLNVRVGVKRVIADRGYDANRIRAALREQGAIPAIP